MSKKNPTPVRAEVDFPSDVPVADTPGEALALSGADAKGFVVTKGDFARSAIGEGFSIEKYFPLADLSKDVCLKGVWLGESGSVKVSDLNDPTKEVDMSVGRLRVGPRHVIKVKLIGELSSVPPGTYVGIMKGEMVQTRKGRMAQDWSVATSSEKPPELNVKGDPGYTE